MTPVFTREFLHGLYSMEPCTSLELTRYLNNSLSHAEVLFVLNLGLSIQIITLDNREGKMLWSLSDLTRYT